MSNQSADSPAGGGGTSPPAASTSSAEPHTGPVSSTAPTQPGATPSGTGGATPSSSGGVRRYSMQELSIGMVLADRYQVLERLSAGGMGVVYKARHVALDDLVALKVLLKPQHEEDQRRFLLEARVATKIKHPNTVYISDFGVMPDGRSYLAMEFLQGQTLAQAIRKLAPKSDTATTAGMDPLRACRIAVQIARGLQAVHDKGIVHRDLKPENVFLLEQDGQPDFVKIVDFGIAKVTHIGGRDKSGPQPVQSRDAVVQAVQVVEESLPNSQNVTLPGSVMGTPAYMSPEAIDGKKIDFHADQYSLGCVLYEMLTGRTPFHSRSTAGMLMKHLTEPVPKLRQGSLEKLVPPSLEAVVMRLLGKQPSSRFASMREVEQALQRESDLILVARGEKTVLPTALAGAIAGKGLGAVLLLGRRRVPLLALLPLALALVAAGGLLTYRLVGHPAKPALKAGELELLRQRSLEVLKKDLEAPESGLLLKLGAAAGLGQSQEPSMRLSIEAVLKNLGAPLELRAQAAEALGQLGDRAAAAALLPLVDERPAPLLVVAAAAALRQLGEPRGEQVLTELLASKDPEAQFRAALLLCEQGPQKARELLHEFLKRSGIPEGIWLNIETCLARAGEEEARRALREKMQAAGPPEPRILSAARLAQLGDGPAHDYLKQLVQKKDPEQLLAARLLAGPDEPALRELFQKVVAEAEAKVPAQKLSAEGLGAIGEVFDARLLGTLLAPGRDPELRQRAATAILQIAAHDPGAWSARSLAWANGALTDRDWLVRQSAAAVLGDSASPSALTLLGGLLKDADARVRRSAVRALGRRSERAALKVLLPGLEDADAGVRSETLKSLGRLLETLARQGARDLLSEVGPWLRRLLERGSASEQLLALELFGRLGDSSRLEQLAAFKDTPDPEVRRLFLEQVETNAERLAATLSDKEFVVRFAAARRLAERGDLRAVAVLREALGRGGAAALLAYGYLVQLKAQVPSLEELFALFAKVPAGERLGAIEAASRLPAEQAQKLLLLAGRDPAPEVRKAVAEAAAELPVLSGQRAGLVVLQSLVTDADAAVRARVQALLAALTQPGTAAAPSPAKSEAETPPPAAETVQRSGEADTAATPLAATGGAPAQASPNGPDAAAELSGLGLLALKGPDFVQYQLDGKRWQYLGGKPLKLPPGPHRLATMSGKQEVVIEEKKTQTVELKPSPIEEAAHNGIEAYQRKDYGKAGKLLERAYQRCERSRSLAQPCENLTGELLFYLGRVHEAQGQTDEAANEYQQVVDSKAQGQLTDKQRDTALAALQGLSQRLGLLILRESEDGECVEKKWWLPPGSHDHKHRGKTRNVKIKARQTLRIDECQ